MYQLRLRTTRPVSPSPPCPIRRTEKKSPAIIKTSKNILSFVPAFARQWPCSLMDRASDYGSEGWGFESLQGHKIKTLKYKGIQKDKTRCVPFFLSSSCYILLKIAYL